MKNKILRKLAMVGLALGAFLSKAPAAMTTFYYDDFNRSGTLDGSTPTITTGTNKWQLTGGDFGFGAGTYVTNGSTVSQATTGGSPFDGWSYLAVNIAGAPILDGASNFTLSLDVNNAGNAKMGIGLNFATPYTGGDMFNGNSSSNGKILGAIGFQNGTVTAATGGDLSFVPSGTVAVAFPGGTTTKVTLSYDQATDVLSFYYGANVLVKTMTATATQIGDLRYVALWNGSFSNNPLAMGDNYTLAIDVPVPEPTTLSILGVAGVVAFGGRRRGRSRASG